MKKSDRLEFFKILADVHDVYRVACSSQAAEMWFATLEVQDIDRVRDAFMSHSRHPKYGRFPPTPADVMRELEDNTQPDFISGAI